MAPANLPFSLGEYAERLAKTRKAMDAAGIEVLFACDPSNIAWLTGYDGWSFYVHQGVIVGPDGPPVWWGRKMDAMGAYRTVYMAADQVEFYTDDYVMNAPNHAMQHLAEVLKDRGWADKTLGIEMENYYYTAQAHAILSAEIDEIKDATNLVNHCRKVKSETELLFMRRAGRIVENMHKRIYEVMEPGLPKHLMAAEITATGIRGGELDGVTFGGDYPAIAPLLPSGADASAAHLTWDDRPFEAGTGTFFEIAGCYRRYHAPLCRTIYLGEPPAEWRRAEEAAIEGINDGINAARAGNTAGDVARAFYASLQKHGIERTGRCGYPIGLSYTPDWGERTFSIRTDDETELTPNMTFHFMPAIWMEDWGLEITEPLRITENGPAECFANVERILFTK